ncbi:MAG: endonuclease domain-containing protein [Candidatus Cloacimonetes bacterium]|nr:endonuclease domain-containing protein [Candidatus Cloacimonadota bacterium]MBL7148490.1 endonuclease domain-containing protein [Candidatus Cloacimonadota bacterium]
MGTIYEIAIETARQLRKNSTETEKIFWEAVRNRKINKEKFNRQFPIFFEYENKNRFFIADFYCHKKKLIIEIDGGIHEQQKNYDEMRTAIINELGVKVIRFNNVDMKNNLNKVIQELKRELTLNSFPKREG